MKKAFLMQTSYDFHTYYIVQYWNVFLIPSRKFLYNIEGSFASLFPFWELRPLSEVYWRKSGHGTKLYIFKQISQLCAQCLKNIWEMIHMTSSLLPCWCKSSVQCHGIITMAVLETSSEIGSGIRCQVQGICLLDDHQMQHTPAWHNVCCTALLYWDLPTLRRDCSHRKVTTLMYGRLMLEQGKLGREKWGG